MATAQQIQEKIDLALQKELTAKQALDAFELPPGGTPEQFAEQKKLRDAYEAAKKERERAEKPLKDARANLEKVRKAISQAENASQNPVSRDVAVKQLEGLRADEQKLLQFLEQGSDQAVVVPRKGRTTLQGPVAPTGLSLAATADAAERAAMARQPAPAVTPTGPAEPTTSSGRGATVRGGRGAKPPKVVNWEPKFREMFPTQAWMLDLDRTKYADVFKLFQQAIDQRWYETPEGQDRFLASLKNTSFDKELASTGKAREIRGLVGDLGFDTVPFNKFLTTAMNMDWEADTLKQEVYKEAFRKDAATGQYVNPTALKRVKASTPYLAVKDIGRQFFSTVDDATTEQVLTGAMVEDDVVRQQREIAKGKYPHLANLIDQGLTLEGVSSSYRQRAATMLEKDINDIDMGSADFAQAFNFGEEGKKRMMGDGEWEILLRSDPRFGWRKTQNAKQEAMQLASSIAQAFGRVL